MKVFTIIDFILTDLTRFVLGFRMNDWEISQLILVDLIEFSKLTNDTTQDKSASFKFQLKTTALNVFACANSLGFAHYSRGLRALFVRFPAGKSLVSLALEEISDDIPLAFGESQYYDLKYILDRKKFISLPPPKIPIMRKVKNLSYEKAV